MDLAWKGQSKGMGERIWLRMGTRKRDGENGGVAVICEMEIEG